MKLSRRSFVKGGTAATAALGAGGAALAGSLRAGPAPALVIYDSRIPESAAFAQGFAGLRLDVADEHARRWKSMRGDLPAGAIIGLTRWSDFVMVRGYAQQRGKRLRLETRAGRLHLWEMG